MRDPRPLRRPVRNVVIGVVLLLGGGCAASPVDRAGGDAARPERVLTLGQFGVGPGPAVQAWADRVKTLSAGSLRIEFKNEWRAHQADFETVTVDDVRARRVDMAVVGARVFDRVGVTSFHALLAPMLVDSQELQSKVFATGIPDEMAQHLERAGVIGLGTLPGPMRKMLGVSKPFLRPADFAGAVVGIQDSALTARTMRALGAVPKAVAPAASLTGLDGYEQQLGSVVGNHYVDAAKYVTANLDLWPRPQVFITSAAVLASLSEQERSALRLAIQTARPVAERAAREEDQTSGAPLCRDGMRLPAASAQDLREVTTALDPVLRELAAEPGTNTWLREIQDLKAGLAAEPDSAGCSPQPTVPANSRLNGTYERVFAHDEAFPGCHPNDPVVEKPGMRFQIVLHDGNVQEYFLVPGVAPDLGWNGPYHVFRDRIDFGVPKTEGAFSVAWTLEGKTLTLSDMKPFTCGDANVWILRAWTKVA